MEPGAYDDVVSALLAASEGGPTKFASDLLGVHQSVRAATSARNNIINAIAPFIVDADDVAYWSHRVEPDPHLRSQTDVLVLTKQLIISGSFATPATIAPQSEGLVRAERRDSIRAITYSPADARPTADGTTLGHSLCVTLLMKNREIELPLDPTAEGDRRLLPLLPELLL